MKKIIIIILLVSQSNLLISCYSVKSITVSELNEIQGKEKADQILITTRDSQKYKFSHQNFYVENDTIYVKGELLFEEGEKPIETKIALSDIMFLETESFDLGNTCLWSGGIFFGIVIIVGIIAFTAGASSIH